jgi:hypothetical protein
MSNFRALFWHEHIGGNQFRLRIRNNKPKDNKQWFVFDKRSRTIRAWSKRGHAISNQNGQRFRIGRAAVIRPYINSVFQRLAFYTGSRRNIRNNGAKCLDVHGGANRHMRHTTFWNCHNGLNQAWFLTKTVPRPLPPAPKPKPAPKPVERPPTPYKPVPVPTPKPKKPVVKPVPIDFKPNPPPKFVKPIDRPIKQRFTWRDMVSWYKRNAKNSGIKWNGARWSKKPTFQYMVDYFVKVIGRRPSKTRYQWLYKIVQCIARKEPINNKVLRTWVTNAIRGRKDKNYKVPACVKHLWAGRLGQKPTYNDLASLVRFAIYNRKISYRSLYLFTWAVLNEHVPAKGHTEFWKTYAGVRAQYVSGLKNNQKFMIFNGKKRVVMGNTLKKFTGVSQRNYFFYDDNTKSIRWLGSAGLHLGV